MQLSFDVWYDYPPWGRCPIVLAPPCSTSLFRNIFSARGGMPLYILVLPIPCKKYSRPRGFSIYIHGFRVFSKVWRAWFPARNVANQAKDGFDARRVFPNPCNRYGRFRLSSMFQRISVPHARGPTKPNLLTNFFGRKVSLFSLASSRGMVSWMGFGFLFLKSTNHRAGASS